MIESRISCTAVALHFAIAGGRSSTDFATAVAAVLVVSRALDQEDSASSSSKESSLEDSASSGSDSDVTLYFTNPGGRASRANCSTAEKEALVMPFALVPEGPASQSQKAGLHRRQQTLRLSVLASSPIVLCVCELHSPFQMGCTKCAMLTRWSVAIVSLASGRPDSIWNPSCTQKASGKHWRPRYPTESHCAAVRCSYPQTHALVAWASMPWIQWGLSRPW